ncbi:unnamed protein product [Notodromas monacha]|uniref:Purple acid phosphatase n=1 Tax=Notodromas monacha TaxID=399045 RepID=A0A7R9BVS3_9CRUS|nr:unnamed protein product [Notodromas monacha]CAG0921665.1 unnamed protein product [Notodromas monacha]
MALRKCKSAVGLILIFSLMKLGLGDQFEPNQIHLALSRNPNELMVVWNTNGSIEGLVQWEKISDPQSRFQSVAISHAFVEHSSSKLQQYVHEAYMTDLDPAEAYKYRVGSKLVWSEWIECQPTAASNSTDWSPRLAVFGDLGLVNAQSIPRLLQDTKRGIYDAVLHVGDFAYDMYENSGRTGDLFMDMIAPIASRVPYMTCPGNHENKDNFFQYRNRFRMPSKNPKDLFYTFNLGPARFISLSTEVYYFVFNYGIVDIVAQWRWLDATLKAAMADRENHPWIIVFGHRPMYCSNLDHDDCKNHETLTRVGLPFFHWYGLEKLLYKYGVDLAIWAHEHSYERLWPVFDRKVYNGTTDPKDPYHNPQATVHVTSGSAGCRERTDLFENPEPWSAFRNSDYGYARLSPVNKTHLLWEQISDDQDGKVIDSIWIKKDKPEGFVETNEVLEVSSFE